LTDGCTVGMEPAEKTGRRAAREGASSGQLLHAVATTVWPAWADSWVARRRPPRRKGGAGTVPMA
jgi:hypothetical protein